MKKILLIALLAVMFPAQSFAQKVMIDQIIKETETGEIRGCGVEFVATDGEANGVQMQAILYSRGNLNWDLAIHLLAGRLNEQNELIQDNIINASIINESFKQLHVISEGRDVSQDSLFGVYPLWVISQMLHSGIDISYQTEEKLDGFIKIPANKEKLKEYNAGCFIEMKGMFREHYREKHGDTACLDNPAGC